jgi:hypothetical protein
MGRSTVINIDFLDTILVLGPERYDPRRYREAAKLTVADVAEISREQIHPGKDNGHFRYLVLDTSDAQEGMIMTSKEPVTSKELGSTKKIVRNGDVIISRLRPYLRQIAYLDDKLTALWPDNVVVACSTEFFVLRGRDKQNIAFLVPYLLSVPIQEVLCASQEGGHHPRFNQKTLETLPLPEKLIEDRENISRSFVDAINSLREANLTIRNLIMQCTDEGSL